MDKRRGQSALHRHLVEQGRDQRPLSLREGRPRPRRDGEPDQGMPRRPVRRPNLDRNPVRQPAAALARLVRLLCAVRRIGLAHTQFAEATCGTIRLKLPKLAGSRPRQRAARQIRARLSLSLTPTNGGWPPPASSQPPDASPRRRKNAAIQPTAHRRPPKDRPHPRKPRQGCARPHYSHCAIIVGARKTKPLV